MTTYFIDTNYFLRFFIKDNVSQHNEVVKLFEKGLNNNVKFTTSIIVLFEIGWVLSASYEFTNIEIAHVLENLLDMDIVDFPEKNIFSATLKYYKETSLGLEDSYNLVYFRYMDFDHFKTFDKKLEKAVKATYK